MFENNTYKPYVLQACPKEAWNESWDKLLQIAHSNPAFLSPRFLIHDKDRIYIGSDLADVYLQDVIGCTRQLTEKHVAVILSQVGAPLCRNARAPQSTI